MASFALLCKSHTGWLSLILHMLFELHSLHHAGSSEFVIGGDLRDGGSTYFTGQIGPVLMYKSAASGKCHATAVAMRNSSRDNGSWARGAGPEGAAPAAHLYYSG